MEQGMLIANRYHIIDKIGQGGMGAVWRVYDRLEKNEVALKQVAKSLNDIMLSTRGATDRKKSALIQEFSLLASLRHPNIISVLDYGIADNKPFFTMELLKNSQTLLEVVQHKTQTEQIEFLIKILQALRYLHRRGVLHRDLKPDNVLVFDNSQVKVLDFGLSVQSEMAEGRVGTMVYMSPESLRDNQTVSQSDLYAVGVMAYEMIAGQRPFHPRDMRGILTQPADMSLLDNHPATLVIERLLLKDPDDRYADADACIRAFQHAMGFPTEIESATVRESYLQANTFVGRDAELQTLTDELDQVLDGRSSFYLVGGESGVGKSRLLNELRIQALVSGVTVLRGQAVEGGGLPFQLWRNVLRRLVLMVYITDLQAGILVDIVPDISELIGRPVVKAPELTGKAYQDRLVLNIVNLFRDVNQPIMLLLEDLQWTIESLAVLKQLLLVREQFHQLMIVGNYRNDEAPNLPDELAPISLIRLERLNSDAVQQLSMSMLGQEGATEQVIGLLQKETEGNLFFLVETVRALAEEVGSLERIGQTTLPDKVFTGGMQRLMQRRLNKVDEQYQPIQALSAVIGREIDIDLLVHQHDLTLVEDWLINASGQAILDIQDNTWHFAHDKLREFILTDMDAETAEKYHRLAAEAIEAVYSDNDAYNEILLSHWHDAGNLDKEMNYAIPILESYLFIQDRIPEAETLIEQGLARLPENDGRRVFLLNWQTYAYLWFHRDTDRAAQTVEKAYQLAKAHHDIQGLAFSLNQLGNVAKRRKNYKQAEDYYKQSLVYDQMIDSSFGVAGNLSDLGLIAQIYGDYKQAQDYYEQSIVIQDSINDQRGKGVNYSNLGLLAFEMGNYNDAETYFQQSVTLSQAIKHQTGIAHNLYRLAAAHLIQSKFHEARDGIEQAMPIFEEINFPHGTVWCLNGLCRMAIQQDETAQVTEMLHQSLSLAVELDRKQLTLYTLATIAMYYHHIGHHMNAMELASFVTSYPSFTKVDHILLDTDLILGTFEVTLSDNDRQVAVSRSKDLDLDTVAHELLDEFGDDT
jgi:predicted ATPase/tRNA A-37 threonylcarbamoyl transferase component Bud32